MSLPSAIVYTCNNEWDVHCIKYLSCCVVNRDILVAFESPTMDLPEPQEWNNRPIPSSWWYISVHINGLPFLQKPNNNKLLWLPTEWDPCSLSPWWLRMAFLRPQSNTTRPITNVAIKPCLHLMQFSNRMNNAMEKISKSENGTTLERWRWLNWDTASNLPQMHDDEGATCGQCLTFTPALQVSREPISFDRFPGKDAEELYRYASFGDGMLVLVPNGRARAGLELLMVIYSWSRGFSGWLWYFWCLCLAADRGFRVLGHAENVCGKME